MHGKELLEKGLLRGIGNGKTTLVWLDKWILDGSPRRPYNKQRTMDLNLKVERLISNQGAWKLDMLREVFFQEDIDKILSFPPAVGLEDYWTWAHSKEGKYNVKSGNWLVTKLNDESNQQVNNNQMVNNLKSKSWKIEKEPKIHLFLSRVLSGALAVAERINAHCMQTNAVCAICRGNVETIKHVLFECVIARQVWSNTKFPMTQWDFGSVEEYMSTLYEIMNKSALMSYIDVQYHGSYGKYGRIILINSTK